MTPCKHCDEGLLAYLYDELAGDERTAFEEHLSASPACTRELQSLRATVRAASADDDLEPPERLLESLRARARLRTVDDPACTDADSSAPPARFRAPAWAAAAAVLITVGAVAWLAPNGDVALAPSDSETLLEEMPAPAAPGVVAVTESKAKRRKVAEPSQFAERSDELEIATSMEIASLGVANQAPPRDVAAALRAGDIEVAWAHYVARYQAPSKAAKRDLSFASKRSRAAAPRGASNTEALDSPGDAPPVDDDLLTSLAPLQAGDERTRAALLVFLQRLGQEPDQETATRALRLAVDLGIGLAQWQDAKDAAVALERIDPTSGQEAQGQLREAQSNQEH